MGIIGRIIAKDHTYEYLWGLGVVNSEASRTSVRNFYSDVRIMWKMAKYSVNNIFRMYRGWVNGFKMFLIDSSRI